MSNGELLRQEVAAAASAEWSNEGTASPPRTMAAVVTDECHV